MKKNILVISMLALFSQFIVAEEVTPSLTKASTEYVFKLLDECKEYAVEDEIANEYLANYLLVCVNDELESGDYLSLESLPIRD